MVWVDRCGLTRGIGREPLRYLLDLAYDLTKIIGVVRMDVLTFFSVKRNDC